MPPSSTLTMSPFLKLNLTETPIGEVSEVVGDICWWTSYNKTLFLGAYFATTHTLLGMVKLFCYICCV